MFKPLLITVRANGFPNATYNDLNEIAQVLIDIYYDTGAFPFDISPYNLTSLNTYMGMYSSFVYFSSPMQVKLASSAFLNFLAKNLEGRKLAHDADNLT